MKFESEKNRKVREAQRIKEEKEIMKEKEILHVLKSYIKIVPKEVEDRIAKRLHNKSIKRCHREKLIQEKTQIDSTIKKKNTSSFVDDSINEPEVVYKFVV